ncbi:MAG: ribose-5-phosphate isomerase RpiA [Melioribacter sp.]|nr:ribose-5-phosphate isomerase RpiA [Melioribacter sp.]
MDNNIELKKSAAEAAVEEVKDGMIVGLGTGSTARFAIEKLANKIKEGKLKNIYGIPTSKRTEHLAIQLGIPVLSLNELFSQNQKLRTQNERLIDITIDGADEVDANLNLIKGGGGALLREKVIAQNTKSFLVVIDESKLSNKLGEKFFVPIEVLQFALESEKAFLESLNAKVRLRKDENGKPYVTDEGNFILDVEFGIIENPAKLNEILNERAGIVEHGIFLNKLVDKVYCSSNSGMKILYAS